MKRSLRTDSMDLALITSGEWAFADSDALKLAGKIVKEHAKLTRHRLSGRSVVLLAPFSGVGWT